MRVPRPWRPVVHPWMLRPAAETRSLATQIDGHLARFDAAVGSGATAPPGEGPIERLRAAICLTRDAFAALADQLDEHGEALRGALADLDALDPRRLDEVRRLRAAVRARTDTLSLADVACRRALEDAVRLVPNTIDVNAQGGWVAALSGARGTSRGRTDAERDVVHGEQPLVAPADEAGGASPVPTPAPSAAAMSGAGRGAQARDGSDAVGRIDGSSAASLHPREGLRALPVASAHRRLRLCPDVARACAADTDPRAVPELAAAVAEPHSLRRVVAVGEAFTALGPERARQIAVLHPGVVGPLDGAPPALRVAANRLLLRVELERARRSDVELESRAIARRVVDGSRWWRRARAALTDAWLTRDAVTSFVVVDTDRPLLVRRDLRIRIRLYASLLYDRVDHGDGVWRPRNVVLFDPVGRGRVAELWGELGPATRRLAVFVPGTGTAVRGFHLPTDVAARLARAAATDGAAADVGGAADAEDARGAGPGAAGTGTPTVVEAWMGCDFPYAVGNQSVRTRFARGAAVPLRDHVEALRRATGVGGGEPDGPTRAGAPRTEPARPTGVSAEPPGATSEPMGPPGATSEPMGPPGATGEPTEPSGATGEATEPSDATGEATEPSDATGEATEPSDATGVPPQVTSSGRDPGASDELVVTVVGHSYGATMVGAAELVGLACDRVVHLASPGAGPGVRSVADYPSSDPLGRPRTPRRFEMTAPGDPIRFVQWLSPVWRPLGRPRVRPAAPVAAVVPAPDPPTSAITSLRTGRGGGLGIAPARLAGVVRLDAGAWEEAVAGHAPGDALEGPAGHAALTASGTTAFRRLVEVVTAPPGRTWRDA